MLPKRIGRAAAGSSPPLGSGASESGGDLIGDKEMMKKKPAAPVPFL